MNFIGFQQVSNFFNKNFGKTCGIGRKSSQTRKPTITKKPDKEEPVYIASECAVCRMSGQDQKIHLMVYCKHPVCYSCLMQYFLNQIADIASGGFECPCCHDPIHPDDFLETLNIMGSDAEFEPYIIGYDGKEAVKLKFENMYLKHTLNKLPGIVWCPGLDCNYAVISSPKSKCPKVKCANKICKTEFCSNCKSPWHEGMTCTQHTKIATEVQDNTLATTEEDRLKICPSCGIAVSKIDDGACNHMKCPVCSNRFCWLCLQPSDIFHFSINGRCPLYGTKKGPKSASFIYPVIFILFAPVIVPVSAVFISLFLVFAYPAIDVIMKKERLSKKNEHMNKRQAFTRWLRTECRMISISILLMTIGMAAALLYFYVMYPISLIRNLISYIKHKRST